jgi:GlpG protein
MMMARFENLRMARAFSDFLRTQKLAHRLVPVTGAVELWVDDDTLIEAVSRELARFRAEPAHPRYLQASWDAPPPDEDVAEISRRYGAGDLSPGNVLRSRGPVTLLLLFACIAVAVITNGGERPAVVEALLFPPMAGASLLDIERPWRVITPILLHFGVVHLVFNMAWWWLLGGVIERFQSSFQLLMLTLGIGLLSNAAQFYVSGPAFGGLSGVIYGLIGYLWLYGKTNPAAGYQLRPAIVNFMLLWMVLGFTGLVGPVANVAHLSGLLAGSVIGVVFGFYRRQVHYRQ